MRRQSIAIAFAGFAVSAALLVLALAGVERTTLSYLAALAWLAGSGGALFALLQGQRKNLRGQAEILKRLDRLPASDDLKRLPKLEDFERQVAAANKASQPAMHTAVAEAVAEANEAIMWAIDARLVGLAEQFFDRLDEAPAHEATS